jgi:hypothetical protein
LELSTETVFQYENTEVYQVTPANTSIQTVTQISSGFSRSTYGGVAVVGDTFTYPFNLQLTFNETGSLYDYGVHLDHAYYRGLSALGFVGRTVKTQQVSDGTQVRRICQPRPLY